MKCANQIARAAGAVALLVSSERALAFEPMPPFPPGPERVVITTGKATGSYLGIGVAEIDAERAKALNLREERGVEVTRVEDESPASKAGLKTSDVVLEFNGQRVEGLEQFIRLVQETPPGREVKLSVSRAGSPQTMTVKTAARKAWMAKTGEAIEIPRFEMPDIRVPDVPRAYMSWRSTVVGIEAESLDSQLAEYFGVKEGVLVRSVTKGSSAEKAGLRAGDVLLKVDGQKVTAPREIASALRSAQSKKNVPLLLMREKRELTLNLLVDPQEPPQAMPKRIR